MDLLNRSATPFYYYDLGLLRRTLDELRARSANDNWHVHYAIKANAAPEIIREIQKAGLGIDAVSGGEIRCALDAGFSPEKIVFAGVGKTDEEIELALNVGIGCFNVESLEELEVIDHIACRKGLKARVALRVNPNIDAHTHKFITTGLAENKFGIDMEVLDSVIDRVAEMNGIDLFGLHFHIGSQITIIRPFEILCSTINSLLSRLAVNGVKIRSINVGGGLGVDYDDPAGHPIPDFASYFDVFKRCLRLDETQQLHFELGRSIVAQCGSLISRVLYVKHGISKDFVIIDAGFTELIRPALYQAFHKIENLTADDDRRQATYDVVGPICESADCFAEELHLPETRRGDIMAIRSAGAYGEIMSSHYNCRSLRQRVVSEGM